MLKTYRRHLKSCEHQAEGRDYRRCRCPIWADGFLQGKRIRQSLDTQNWEKAQETIRDWEIDRSTAVEEPQSVTIDRAAAAFLADAESRGLTVSSLKKYRVLLTNKRPEKKAERCSPSLVVFAQENGLRFTNQLTLEWLQKFRAAWKDHNTAARKKLERLKAFCRFVSDNGWTDGNIAVKLKAPVVNEPPTMPFTQQEVIALLAACERFPDWHGQTGQDNAKRLRGLVLLMRYSGLRIGDAVSCAAERLKGDRLFLYTAKTGTPVHAKLPPAVVASLGSLPCLSPQYWFWTGQGSVDTVAGNYRRAFRRLCELAEVTGGHPHRFRDTFAVELLLAGVPIERVSILLGHSSVRVTEKHYSPWVAARQEQLEADLARTWRGDAVLLAESAPKLEAAVQ